MPQVSGLPVDTFCQHFVNPFLFPSFFASRHLPPDTDLHHRARASSLEVVVARYMLDQNHIYIQLALLSLHLLLVPNCEIPHCVFEKHLPLRYFLSYSQKCIWLYNTPFRNFHRQLAPSMQDHVHNKDYWGWLPPILSTAYIS